MTDADRDKMIIEGFEQIAAFFETSLTALASENPQIEVAFRRIDADTFTATAYRAGKITSFCRIFVGSALLGRGIAFSSDAHGIGHSFNENLRIEVIDGSLGFAPSGISTSVSRKGGLLTEKEAADFYWELFSQSAEDLSCFR